VEAIESMHSQVDQISPILVEVKVEVPWDKVNESLELAYRNLQRTARVRGFRPGKVPRNVVKNLMGKSVEQDVSNQLFEQALGEAVKEHSLEPISVSAMDSPALSQGQPWSFKAKLEVRPKVGPVNTSALTIQRKLEPVTDADIERELQQMRERNAEIVSPAESRPARQGDILTLDIAVSVEGQPRADLSSTDTRAELGAERLLSEIEAALEGASVGEEREVNLTFPENYSHEGLQGKPASFKLSVKQLQEKVLPDLDDELAKDLEHESLDALRDDIRKRLTEQATRRTDSSLREDVVERLVDANPVPVPPSLVERQERAMLNELLQFQQMLGRPIPFDDAMHKELRTRAERKIQAVLVLAALAEQQKVTVSDDEVEAKLKEIADQGGKHIAKVRAEYQGERRETLHSQLLHNKLLEYLLSQATITEGSAQDAPKDEPSKKEPSKDKPSAEKQQAKSARKESASKSQDTATEDTATEDTAAKPKSAKENAAKPASKSAPSKAKTSKESPAQPKTSKAKKTGK
jgi:trigger factor